VRNWSVGIEPEQFRWIAGENEAGKYGFAADSDRRRLRVGGAVHARDLDVEALVDAPLRYMNGRDNDWFHPPQETRQL